MSQLTKWQEKTKQEYIEKKKHMNKIEQLIAEANLHPVVKKQVEQFLKNYSVCDCSSPQPEIAVIAASRYDYSTGGGVARYSQLHIFYLDSKEVKEWQYADKWSSRNDRRNLMINQIANVEAEETNGKISITVECVPAPGYSNWFAKFSFEKKDSIQDEDPKLSDEEKEKFKTWANEECKKIHTQHLQNWEKNSHTQPSAHGRLPYRCPQIKDFKINESSGIAIFVTEEQIDFRGVDNAQMQQKAFLLNWKEQKVSEIKEVHAYEQSGSSNLDIISVGSKDIMLGTPEGPLNIKI